MKALLDAMRTGTVIDIEYRIKTIDRGWRWMRSEGAPRIGSAGQIVRWYGSLEDVDERRNPAVQHS
jgi:PAS domain-containing protein